MIVYFVLSIQSTTAKATMEKATGGIGSKGREYGVEEG